MWWQSLLPVYGLSFRMRFTGSSNPGFFHQGALSAWLRTVLGSPDDYGQFICSDALEQGHRRFAAGDEYRFAVFGIGGRGRAYLTRLPEAIATFSKDWDAAMPFRDNWKLDAIEHWATGAQLPGNPLAESDIPLALDVRMLEQEMAFWRRQKRLSLRLQSPLRVTRADKKSLKGELRYCRDAADLRENALWLVRVDDSLRRLAEDQGADTPPRTALAPTSADVELFWVNASYRDENRKAQSMGGLLGEICIHDSISLSDEALALLVIGQYLGVGQRRVFGNGRYRLIGDDDTCTFERWAAVGWLECAMREDNLHNAWQEIVDVPDRDTNMAGYPEQEGEEKAENWDRDSMLSRAGCLLRSEYRPPALHGFVHEDADGGLRPLAAPPLTDRVLQRAVHQAISPALDLIMDEGSYGYRAGRSRFQVRDMIQYLYREGYRWVFESDIHSFFDTVTWEKLRIRLNSLLADRQAVYALMGWMQAPVLYKGERIERSRGLPQGSPLSPVLANLMLDDFDHDLRDAGCRLIRFADDFVIVAKTKTSAELGGRLAEKALIDVGLTLNREKTKVTPFSQGFRFLGFMFVDGMAVECAPKRSEDAGKPPPQSWLVRATSQAENETSREEQLRGTMPAPVSLYENRGQMLIFCGETAMLFTRGGRARIERDDECLMEAPWGHLDGIVLFGRHHITTPAIIDALAHDVPIHLASGSGHYRGMIYNPRCALAGALWLGQQQLFSDEESAMQAAKSVVGARIRHMHETLRRREGASHDGSLSAMESNLREVDNAESREQLNGIEGNATKHYFEGLRVLVPEAYGFHRRERRPPTDPFNALLSLGYTHLYAHMDTLLRTEGLLPEKGFYHQERSGHAALASDLMEPFRHIVERCALSMVQRGKLGTDDFSMQGEKGCRMTAAGRRVYLASLSEAMLAPVRVAGGGEPAPILDHMHRQAIALKFWVAGKSSRFDAWRMR